ncbi:xanthine dehydrogenase family protein molybdopterin-binding subunit [Marivivens aquimaris]|uniref:xanthine dehydrogenase family protein molybdopterin-binding subunit n=1 Tax=Marivivens aquimaris TaxID=2774876 RepID=UPI00187FFE40|nr:molybdopterin cofactor-binding domain-containing protein [Marivivens aquimaris]
MSRIGKIARRTFLFGAVAVTGGAAFGYYKLVETPPNPLKPTEGVALNPYVIVDGNGVTVVAPRAEMGQGISTTLAALVSEELDVAVEDVTVIHGPPAKAYFNQAIMGAAFPVLEYKRKDWQEDAAHFVGNAAKFFNMQITGGSSSTKDGYVKMREAGAQAREMLKEAAAKRLSVAADRLGTDNGAVVAPDGTRIPYSDLAGEVAGLEPREVALRDPSDWKVLRTSQPRTDMVGKSTGTATFGIDVRVPGMKFATVRMSPRRAGMVTFDASDAILMDGVEKIIDLGDGIAVVAQNTWLAIQAAEAVSITWADASYDGSTEQHIAALISGFDTEPNNTGRDEGDVTQDVAGTEVTAEYTVPFLAHATMEPMNATALYTGDALEVWAPNQAPVKIRDGCAEAVGLNSDAVTVHTTLMGGGFGRRGEFDYAVIAARVAHEMPDVPVQVTWSREEDMRHDYYRPAAMARMRGVVDGGKPVLLDAKVSSPSATHQAIGRMMGMNMSGPDAEITAGMHDQPFAIPNYRTTAHIADIGVPMGFWRSVGASYNGFFTDCFIDEMAVAAGADPLQFRLDMVRPEHEPSAKVIEAVAEMSNWGSALPAGTARGVAFTYSFGTPVAQVMEIAETGSGIKMNKVWIACDPGIALDPRNIEAQMTGGCIYGLSAALHGRITFEDGEAQQYNFPDYDAVRMYNTPAFEVRILENAGRVSGVGEPGTPPAAAALANALFALTGKRARSLPLSEEYALII